MEPASLEAPVHDVIAQGTITRLIQKLKDGESQTAQRLWEFYFRRIAGMAREQLQGMAGGMADEENVALETSPKQLPEDFMTSGLSFQRKDAKSQRFAKPLRYFEPLRLCAAVSLKQGSYSGHVP